MTINKLQQTDEKADRIIIYYLKERTKLSSAPSVYELSVNNAAVNFSVSVVVSVYVRTTHVQYDGHVIM